jgi:hypothetical protein
MLMWQTAPSQTTLQQTPLLQRGRKTTPQESRAS